jgi:Domain of unknown function (DUF4865)
LYAMQYEMTLPVDYDMGIIRERIATRSHLTDDYAGLGFKAYLYREHGVDGSQINQYSCFYLWNEIAGMNRFLWGNGGFGGIVATFGRPVVRHFTGVAAAAGPARGSEPTSATRQIEQLPPDVDPSRVVEAELGDFRGRAKAAGVHTAAFAIDPRSWELVRFTLWQGAPDPDVPGERYQVRHLSAPAAGLEAVSKQWV